jgi:lysine biosynthesis protein LysW
MATCPECDAEMEIDEDDIEEMEVGDPWDCDACGSHLRVASLDPLDFESDDDEDEEEEDDEDSEDSDESDDDDLDDEDDKDGDGGGGDWEE